LGVVGTLSGIPLIMCLPKSGSLAVRELPSGVKIGLATDYEVDYKKLGIPAGRALIAKALNVLRGSTESVSGFNNYIILAYSLSSSPSLGISCSRRERVLALLLSFPRI
jgi:hypothetical protein